MFPDVASERTDPSGSGSHAATLPPVSTAPRSFRVCAPMDVNAPPAYIVLFVDGVSVYTVKLAFGSQLVGTPVDGLSAAIRWRTVLPPLPNAVNEPPTYTDTPNGTMVFTSPSAFGSHDVSVGTV